MRNVNFCVFDTLESRTFLSAGSSQVVIADRAQIVIDVKLMHADTKACQATIKHDESLVHKAIANVRFQVQAQIKADMASSKATLASDRKAILTARRVDLKVIQSDKVKLHTDHADVTAESQDEVQLQADTQTMDDDLSTLDAHLQADETASAQVIANDRAEGDARMNGGDAAVLADEAELAADQQSCQDTLQADSDRLHADHVKLQVDLNAQANGSTTA